MLKMRLSFDGWGFWEFFQDHTGIARGEIAFSRRQLSCGAIGIQRSRDCAITTRECQINALVEPCHGILVAASNDSMRSLTIHKCIIRMTTSEEVVEAEDFFNWQSILSKLHEAFHPTHSRIVKNNSYIFLVSKGHASLKPSLVRSDNKASFLSKLSSQLRSMKKPEFVISYLLTLALDLPASTPCIHAY